MRRDLLIYLAGPITATATKSTEDHVAAAVNVYLRLIRAGLPAFCPHLTAAFPSAFGILYDTWMAYDYAVLDRCNAVLMLDGWRESRGAMLEREYARQHGLTVYEDVDTLIARAKETSS